MTIYRREGQESGTEAKRNNIGSGKMIRKEDKKYGKEKWVVKGKYHYRKYWDNRGGGGYDSS